MVKFSYKGVGVVATPQLGLAWGLSLPEEIYRGGTQVDDFNKGKLGRIFTKFLRRRNGGGQGDWDPLIENKPRV